MGNEQRISFRRHGPQGSPRSHLIYGGSVKVLLRFTCSPTYLSLSTLVTLAIVSCHPKLQHSSLQRAYARELDASPRRRCLLHRFRLGPDSSLALGSIDLSKYLANFRTLGFVRGSRILAYKPPRPNLILDDGMSLFRVKARFLGAPKDRRD